MAQITLGFPNLELLWRFLIDCHVANVSTDAQGFRITGILSHEQIDYAISHCSAFISNDRGGAQSLN
jgi:hypothetical protein